MIDRLQFWAIVAIVVLSGVALFNISSEESSSQPMKPIECVDTASKDKIQALTLAAIDAAFTDSAMHLFSVWMRDEKDQPRRAQNGMQQAIRGYLEARRLAESWKPPPC